MNKSKHFDMRIDDLTKFILENLAKQQKVSQSELVRKLLEAAAGAGKVPAGTVKSGN